MVLPDGTDELAVLARRAADGDAAAWRQLLDRAQPRLRRMVAVRLDDRLRARVDPSDVLQEAYIDALGLLPRYVREPTVSPYLWLRLVTGHRLAKIHRHHLGVQARAVTREDPRRLDAAPEASCVAIADYLVGEATPPDRAAARAELRDRVRAALAELDPLDREAIALRHFEQLNATEAAKVLGISPAAAGKRYFRAVTRLTVILGPLRLD
ncbi:MAG: sigma-70 family RNA polymerase sigma factor [Gemmataceae bacterium]